MKNKFAITLFASIFCFLSLAYAISLSGLMEKARKKYDKSARKVQNVVIEKEIQFYLHGNKLFQNTQKPIKAKTFIKGSKYRVETDMSSLTYAKGQEKTEGDKLITIFDGNDLWQINPYTGKSKIESSAQKKSNGNTMLWYYGLDKNAELSGYEMLEGKMCYLVSFQYF